MKLALLIAPVAAAGAAAASWSYGLSNAIIAGLAAGCAAWALLSSGVAQSRSGTVRIAASPALLASRRRSVNDELAVLADAEDLQHGVFEVSAELVGCVDEEDARIRFAAAMRRYWHCDAVDLLLWERGTWRSLGGEPVGAAPALRRPVELPAETGGDLVLDLSPAVSGQAALVLRNAQPQPSLAGRSDEDQRYVAEVLRGQLALSLRRVVLYGELQSLARIDPLTGAHRRWYGEMRLRELVDGGEVVAVAMVDIDHFKRVNDGHGHAAGDQVLRGVGRSLSRLLRAGDLVCRFGGEEFLVILPETSPQGALLVAERLRAAVSAMADLPVAVTVSIGVAACHQDEGWETMVSRADEALYRAKRQGRNRTVLAEAGNDTSHIRTTSRRQRSEGRR